MLVCGRVDVLWQQHKAVLVSSIQKSEFLILSMKISEFLSSARAAIDEILLDDSLKWEYVLAHKPTGWHYFDVICRHVQDMTVSDVLKVHAYFNTGLLSILNGGNSPLQNGEAV